MFGTGTTWDGKWGQERSSRDHTDNQRDEAIPKESSVSSGECAIGPVQKEALLLLFADFAWNECCAFIPFPPAGPAGAARRPPPPGPATPAPRSAPGSGPTASPDWSSPLPTPGLPTLPLGPSSGRPPFPGQTKTAPAARADCSARGPAPKTDAPPRASRIRSFPLPFAHCLLPFRRTDRSALGWPALARIPKSASHAHAARWGGPAAPKERIRPGARRGRWGRPAQPRLRGTSPSPAGRDCVAAPETAGRPASVIEQIPRPEQQDSKDVDPDRVAIETAHDTFGI